MTILETGDRIMSRREADREDLLAEGVNLPQRGRITDTANDRAWVLGWRQETALSLFDHADPVFQFNRSGQLRRVYLDGQKLAAHAGKLTQLQKRPDSGARLTFQHQPLSVEQQDEVQRRLAASLHALRHALSSADISVETIGLDADSFLDRVKLLCDTELPVAIAASPNVD